MIHPGIDHIIFDWGDTVMKDDPSRTDAMYLWPKVELAGNQSLVPCASKVRLQDP